ncbi:MAG TPA: NfeD family protein [Alcanivoracaceae bacterium]|nr:NfeD family protein [Alcanivoracaceae bacterium]
MISEVLTPGVFVVVFFGFGALVVGALTWLGLVDSWAWQLVWFATASLVSLVIARRRFQALLKGDVSGASYSGDSDMIGKRVKVLTDFKNGNGVVFFRGARWEAVADEPLKANSEAWIVGHSSITLTVSSKPL